MLLFVRIFIHKVKLFRLRMDFRMTLRKHETAKNTTKDREKDFVNGGKAGVALSFRVVDLAIVAL